ncbi:LysR family transcriptional regulator [Massilia endophytica]|uniref:LysR family transcriptional regulator n=1 Tax=Massilia endophytica TaxID=2899220 RepID=UPI001E4A634E|nr:LysR family transcriptional regulator [Massilia endophytica]UGQ48415.1 LysR family transcriptional regulator [Massilia endophytica]
MNTPDWNDLRFFVAVHMAGSLSGAARACGVEHSTVARRLEALEAALGVRLFDRLPRGWSLTQAGHELMPHAQRMEEDLHALMRAASGSAELKGTVRVSAPPALAAWLLAPRLRDALPALGSIELDLRAETHNTDLARRESDIALRFQRPSSPGLVVKQLATVGYALCGSEDYVQGRDAADWEFLGYDAQLEHTPQHAWLESVRGGRRYVLRSNDLASLRHAALAGCGVAVLPDYMAEGLAAVQDCPVKRELWLVMHEDVRRSPPVRAVADRIIALFDQSGM